MRIANNMTAITASAQGRIYPDRRAERVLGRGLINPDQMSAGSPSLFHNIKSIVKILFKIKHEELTVQYLL